MVYFPTTLEHRVVILDNATEVARFSFIVRNSISYLDLELCHHEAFELSNSFINTEEKCRKFFTRSRSLLYTLHLDLPKRRESILKYTPYCLGFKHNPEIPHIARIHPTYRLPISILNDCIEDVITKNNKKLKTLAWILKIGLFHVLDIQTVNKFIDCFYPDITDSAIFKEFIMHFDSSKWINTYEKPQILEYLLYYARSYGREDLKLSAFAIYQVIDECILRGYFLNMVPLLKYTIPEFSDCCYYRWYVTEVSSMRPNLQRDVLYNFEKWMKRRVRQMLRIIFMYLYSRQYNCTEAASEALRLIWCNVPDSLISFKEVKTAFRGVFNDEKLKNIYDFYATAVGEFHENVEPRSLQHLCRPIIRTALSESLFWIPEGLRQMCLPKSIESFLNLEEVSITSKEFAQ